MILFVVVFAAALLWPPFWLIGALMRRLQRARSRTEPAGWITPALVAAMAVAGFEVLVVVPTSVALLRDKGDLGAIHAAALFLSWLCLWARIALRKFLRPGGRRSY